MSATHCVFRKVRGKLLDVLSDVKGKMSFVKNSIKEIVHDEIIAIIGDHVSHRIASDRTIKLVLSRVNFL